MLSASLLMSHWGYPLDLNFSSSLSRMLVKTVGEDVHLSALRISPLRIVLKVGKGWQELKCRKHCGFVSLMWRLTSRMPFSMNLLPL